MSAPEVRALQGIVWRSRDPEALARRWKAALGLPELRRSRSEIVLGRGVELFVVIRRVGPRGREGLEEVHVLVEEIARTRRKTSRDLLGGNFWSFPLEDGVRLVARELLRPPSRKWLRARRPVK